MVDETQSGFTQGRSILDKIVLAKEVIHHCKRTKKQGFLLKLDFEKTYDMVNWDCLLEVIKKRGFGDRLVQWVEIWLVSAKIQTIVDGEIACKRGLR